MLCGHIFGKLAEDIELPREDEALGAVLEFRGFGCSFAVSPLSVSTSISACSVAVFSNLNVAFEQDSFA